MNITFTARRFTASDRLKTYAEEQTQKLGKFFDGILDCEIVLEPTESPTEPQAAELIVKVPRTVLHARGTGPHYEQAISAAADTMRRQLIKHKEKLNNA